MAPGGRGSRQGDSGHGGHRGLPGQLSGLPGHDPEGGAVGRTRVAEGAGDGGTAADAAMSGNTHRITRRTIRRAFGPVVSEVIESHEGRIQAHAAILRRGFWGRLKWLVFGR